MKTINLAATILFLSFTNSQNIYSYDKESSGRDGKISTCQKVTLGLSAAGGALLGAAKLAVNYAVKPICAQLPKLAVFRKGLYELQIPEFNTINSAQKIACDYAEKMNSTYTYTSYACLATALFTAGYKIYTKAKRYTVVSTNELVKLQHDHEMGKPVDDEHKFD